MKTKALNILNDLSEHISIKINSCRRTSQEIGWIESKAHNDYDIWYILSGEVSVKVGTKIYMAYEGDIVFFYPDMPYTAYNNKSDCKFIYIHFDFGVGNNSRILDGFNLAGIMPSKIAAEEAAIFAKACTEFEKNSPMSSIFLKGSFTMLLASILSYYSNEFHLRDNYVVHNRFDLDNINNQKRKDTAKLTVLQPVFHYVSNNINKPIKVDDLSTSVNMSEKYFISYFKSALGITPGNYITQLKMNKARDYIYQKKYSIKEIANLLGYSDQYTFSKAFKKYFNVPPSKFI